MITEKFDHVTRLGLPDASDGATPMEIDILVGLDHYWELVTGETQRRTSGPLAINTRIGWVLSGSVPCREEEQWSTNLITIHMLNEGGWLALG